MSGQEKNKGLVHLYYGNGQGKTTAAMGLALRMLGNGGRVVIVQFLKDGNSGELGPLKSMGVTVFSHYMGARFIAEMTDEEKDEERAAQTEILRQGLAVPCDLLILDEACTAWEHSMVDKALLKESLKVCDAGTELVFTGRLPAPWMEKAADYCTKMQCANHPLFRGIQARKGIEF